MYKIKLTKTPVKTGSGKTWQDKTIWGSTQTRRCPLEEYWLGPADQKIHGQNITWYQLAHVHALWHNTPRGPRSQTHMSLILYRCMLMCLSTRHISFRACNLIDLLFFHAYIYSHGHLWMNELLLSCFQNPIPQSAYELRIVILHNFFLLR